MDSRPTPAPWCAASLSANCESAMQGNDASLSRRQHVFCQAHRPDQHPAATLHCTSMNDKPLVGPLLRNSRAGLRLRRAGGKGVHLGQLGHAGRSFRALCDDRMSACERLRAPRPSCARSPAARGAFHQSVLVNLSNSHRQANLVKIILKVSKKKSVGA